jgi:hypothetical protein
VRLPFFACLEAAADRYVALQQKRLRHDPGDGGWAASANGVRTINATAEVLSVLSAYEYPADSPEVAKASEFIIRCLEDHPRAVQDGGKGEHFRYPIWGVFGLTAYGEQRERPDVTAALEWCASWLDRYHCSGGGWPETKGDDKPSLVFTAYGVLAASRIPDLLPDVEHARTALGNRFDAKLGAWPATPDGKRADPAKTALCVLALAGGDSKDKERASVGKGWLRDHRWQWERKTHGEREVRTMEWDHMTFSLGLRACLESGVAPDITPLDQDLHHTIDFLDTCWEDPEREWREGKDGRTSTRASAAVVAAWQAIQAAYSRIDPSQVHAAIVGHERGPRSTSLPLECQIAEGGVWLAEADGGGSPLWVPLAETRLAIVDTLAELQATYTETGVPLVVLADRLGKQDDSVRRTIDRINKEDTARATEDEVDALIEVRKKHCWFTTRRVVRAHLDEPTEAVSIE